MLLLVKILWPISALFYLVEGPLFFVGVFQNTHQLLGGLVLFWLLLGGPHGILVVNSRPLHIHHATVIVIPLDYGAVQGLHATSPEISLFPAHNRGSQDIFRREFFENESDILVLLHLSYLLLVEPVDVLFDLYLIKVELFFQMVLFFRYVHFLVSLLKGLDDRGRSVEFFVRV